MLAVLSSRVPESVRYRLRAMDYLVLSLPPFPALSAPVCDHPDMLLFSLDDRLFCPAAYAAQPNAAAVLSELTDATGMTLCPLPSHEILSADYPNDVKLNALLLRNSQGTRYLFAHPTALSPTLHQTAIDEGVTVLPVRQGYASCSTAVIAEDAIITADCSIANAAQRVGIDVLLISPGHIELPGYNCGFIGGASGYDAVTHTLFLCGDPTHHPDHQNGRIQAFCHAHGCHIHTLPSDHLTDIGGIQFYSIS